LTKSVKPDVSLNVDRYQRAGFILTLLFLSAYVIAFHCMSQPPDKGLPAAEDIQYDVTALTEEEKQNYGPDEAEQNYGIFLNPTTGKKCSTYDPAKSDALANQKHDPEYRASLLFAVYGSCPR
jgi:hypothetical protein